MVSVVHCSLPSLVSNSVSLTEKKASDEGMQVAISEVLLERARLPLLALC